MSAEVNLTKGTALKRLDSSLMLKSPGTWFFGGNGFLNGQTHPVISFVYAGIFATQRVLSLRSSGNASNPVARLILGPQGLLFVNAATTAVTGVFTGVYGSPALAKACLDFCLSNGIQSFVWGNVIKFPDTKRGQIIRNGTLAGCEIGILDGLRHVAENAGFSPTVSFELILPGIAAALVRGFKPKWLPADLAYADMMALAAVTGAEAFIHDNPLNGFSRILAFVAFSRLAVTRVQNDNKNREDKKTSIFEIETHIPRLIRRLFPSKANQ
jgi:hypothetical protein